MNLANAMHNITNHMLPYVTVINEHFIQLIVYEDCIWHCCELNLKACLIL